MSSQFEEAKKSLCQSQGVERGPARSSGKRNRGKHESSADRRSRRVRQSQRQKSLKINGYKNTEPEQEEGKKGTGSTTESRLPPSNPKKKSFSVFVGNLPRDISKQELQELFKGVGPVYDVFVNTTLEKTMDRTYGFVRFLEAKYCLKAIKDMNRWCFQDQQIRVELAKETIQDRNGGEPQLRREQHNRPLQLRKSPEDDEILWKLKQMCTQFNNKRVENMRRKFMNEQAEDSRPMSPMPEIDLPLFLKEVQKADPHLTHLVRFDLPRVSLDLDEFDEAFTTSEPASTDGPLMSSQENLTLPTLPTSRLPKTPGLSERFMNFKTPISHTGSLIGHSSTLPQESRNGSILYQAISETMNTETVHKPFASHQPKPAFDISPQTYISNEQPMFVSPNSSTASSVPLSTRYQPLRTQQTGFDKYVPGVYELDVKGQELCNVFADKSPTGLQCTLTPKGSRKVIRSPSPDPDDSKVLGLQCTLTPKGSRSVTNSSNQNLTALLQSVPITVDKTPVAQLSQTFGEVQLSNTLNLARLQKVSDTVHGTSLSQQTHTFGERQLSSDGQQMSNSMLSSVIDVTSAPDCGIQTPETQVQHFLSSVVSNAVTRQFPVEQTGQMVPSRGDSLSRDPNITNRPTCSSSKTPVASMLAGSKEIKLYNNQIIDSGVDLDSDFSQTSRKSSAMSDISVNNNYNGVLDSGRVCEDHNQREASVHTPPHNLNVSPLSTSISPRPTEGTKPLFVGRGRGLLALQIKQNVFRPVGGDG